MSDGQETGTSQARGPGSKTLVGKAFDFVIDHPKTSMLLGAGMSAVAGAELLAAALVGGAVVLVFTPRSSKA